MLGNKIDITAPFIAACIFFLFSTVFARFAIPYISPDSMSGSKKPGQRRASGFLEPLKILMPQRLRLRDGKLRKHYGVIFLCAGIFTGVVSSEP